jgi:hypothetical protein
MKKYIAIGHWEGSQNTTSVVMMNNTIEDFKLDLKGNAFKAYAVLTEKTFNEIKAMGCLEIYDRVKKLTSNWRKYNEITDYIEQCADIIEDRLAIAQ